MIIDVFANPGDLVVDPFMGSGVLASICKEKNVYFRGADINPSALAVASIFVNPPTTQEVTSALEKISKDVEQCIRDLYRNKAGIEATHIVRKKGEIQEIWVASGRKTILSNVGEWDFTDNDTHYAPSNFCDRKLIKNSRINVAEDQTVSSLFSSRALIGIDLLLEAISKLTPHEQEIAKYVLTSSLGQMSNMVFAIKRRNRNNKQLDHRQYEVGSWVIGYWRPKLNVEVNVWRVFHGRAKKLAKAIDTPSLPDLFPQGSPTFKPIMEKKDGFELLSELDLCSVDLVITDPPHSDRIPYLELSEMWNTIVGEEADFQKEWVLSNAKQRNKSNSEFNKKLIELFQGAYSVLKQGGRFVMMFNTTNSGFWKILKEAASNPNFGMKYEGRFPVEYSARSVVQDSRAGALQHDWCLVFAKGAPSNDRCSEFKGWTTTWID